MKGNGRWRTPMPTEYAVTYACGHTGTSSIPDLARRGKCPECRGEKPVVYSPVKGKPKQLMLL